MNKNVAGITRVRNLILLTCLIIGGVLGVVQAQTLELIADYPLMDDLQDDTGFQNDVFLEGNPGLPDLPMQGAPLCNNGIYIVDPDGQNIQTPTMAEFDINNFQIEIDFNISVLPLVSEFRPRNPVIMGGNFARWIGIYVDSNARMGVKFNNDVPNYRWSNAVTVAIDTWYSARLRYLNGTVELFFDGQLILTESIGPLAPFQDDFNFTVTDFSEGNPIDGCIRNLKISSSLVVFFKNGFE